MKTNSRLHRRVAYPLLVALGTALMIATPAPTAAFAAPKKPDCGRNSELTTFSGVRKWKATSTVGQFMQGPASVTYADTRTLLVSATLSGSTKFSVSAVVVSAEATVGVALTDSYSRSTSWSYQIVVPAGKDQRAVLTKLAYQAGWSDSETNSSCHITTTTGKVTAPVSSTSSTTLCWVHDDYPATTIFNPAVDGSCGD